MSRFIRVLQKDIVTNPEQWKDAGPGKFLKLPDRAKRVYCVLSVIAFSTAGNAEGKFATNVGRLGKGWFWTSHALLQQLTGSCQKTVQRAIKELEEAGFIGYHPAKKNGHQCFFKIMKIGYNGNQDFVSDGYLKSKRGKQGKKELSSESPASTSDWSQKDISQGKPDKIEMLNEKKEILFQRGKDTHDESGTPLNSKGSDVPLDFFEDAERAFKDCGEMAFLVAVNERKIENHLVPEYREKFETLKEERKLIPEPDWPEFITDFIPF